MANIAATETNKFVGISALKVVKGGFATGFTLGDGAFPIYAFPPAVGLAATAIVYVSNSKFA